MTKTCKRTLFITVLTLLLAACMCFAVGCDNGAADNVVAYTVTVTADNEPATGVKVTVKKGTATFGTETTGNDGKVTFKLAPDSYTVTLSNLPANYGVPTDAKLDLTAESRDLNVTLAKSFGYTVKLVGPDGQPYYNNGTTMGVCTLAGNCLEQVALGENGTTFLPAPKSDYHVKIENLPHNVAFERDEDGYYTGKNFSATETEMTIQLYAVTDVLAQTEMTAAEKEAYGEENLGFDTNKPTYKLTGTLKPGETKYYSITPAYNSSFTVYRDYNASYVYNGKAFQLGNTGGYFSPALPIMQANETYYFNVSNVAEEGGEEVEFECVVSAPIASYHEVSAGPVTVTLDKVGANAVIAFKPKTAAAYTLTVDGDELADIVYCESSYDIEHTEHDETAFVKNATASAKVTAKNAGTKTLYFAVAAKTAPATLKVKIEKGNDITDTTVVKHVEKPLTNFADQGADKELVYVPFDGTANLVYDDENGYYTLGEGGPIVVVRLTTAINDDARFQADGALVYLEYAQKEGYLAPYVFDTTTEADLADLKKGDTTTDYRVMLRGFAEYELDDDGNHVKPENITEASYYAKHVNKDGVYPLTQELEEYLKAVANDPNYGFLISWDAAPGYEWLFACYYYADFTEADVVVGEYEFVKFTNWTGDDIIEAGQTTKEIGWDDEKQESIMGTIGADEYKLVVNKLGTFAISQINGAGEYEQQYSGTWKNEDGTYTFTIPALWEDEDDIVYTVTFNATEGTITLSDGGSSEEWQFTRKTA